MRVTLPRGPQAVRTARQFTRIALEGRAPAAAADDVLQVVSELVTHAVGHEGAPVALTIQVLSSSCLVTVFDASPLTAADWEMASAVGVAILSSLATLYQTVDSEGMSVSAELQW